ncbi:helix-turn-helix transcriptional regulator [Pseudomonas cichorii]|uniref:helix-turn-helix transcriptional regulator n=1 Tax=Pseudomonas cichorii TaxID=36746 RepID=UPI0018E62537|nr:helix-turn-helix transcriptional regulator [Pseudomonas cichorii]MBI6853225.1 helix-turn-helix transcriptional regulator [Pseudomonas cichorii]
MKLTTSLEHSHDPRFYQHLGQLISSTGSNAFARQMLQLVDALVPVHGLELNEWALDIPQACISQTNSLGNAGLQYDFPATNNQRPPLLQSVMQMDAPLLIQLKVPSNTQNPQYTIHQCNLVSSRAEQRWIICFYRLPTLRPFSLSELSLLKSLSDTLLPLVEHHAQLLAQPVTRVASTARVEPEQEAEAASMHQAFSGRLAQDAIILSAREQEVCLGLLTGGTVPEMAQRLRVKASSVETYLKRATVKLGISGRHGLARWMAGA